MAIYDAPPSAIVGDLGCKPPRPPCTVLPVISSSVGVPVRPEQDVGLATVDARDSGVLPVVRGRLGFGRIAPAPARLPSTILPSTRGPPRAWALGHLRYRQILS